MAPNIDIDSRPRTGAQYEYPFAASADILRSHEKDTYIAQTLSTQASSILQSLLGVRFAHRHAGATGHLVQLLYLGLTTLPGNRTLGEEYCDVVQIEDDTLRLPSLGRRLGYIVSVVFAPWLLGRILPSLRRKLRAKLERQVARAEGGPTQHEKPRRLRVRLQAYLLQNIDAITSLTPVHAVTLVAFYLSGSYYHLSKRLWGLRYIFTRRIRPNEERVGYEVLGMLLALQMLVQCTLHLRQIIDEIAANSNAEETRSNSMTTTTTTTTTPSPSQRLSQLTHTPILSHPRYNLDPTRPPTPSPTHTTKTTSPPNPPLAWISPPPSTTTTTNPSAKCTLCLEHLKDPSVTTCGHIFCWSCIQDWIISSSSNSSSGGGGGGGSNKQAECPLCRQSILMAKVLVLRS